MENSKLRELMDSLTIQEKIGQLVQLSGSFFSDDPEILTGPAAELGISQEMINLAGSTLNVYGAENVIRMQKKHMEKSRIPMLFMGDVIYGYKTVYPVPLALGASFNPELVQKCYSNIAAECSTSGIGVTFSPMVDVARDARWGRCVESPGEDTCLNSRMSAAMVKGFQGDGLANTDNVASCVKHFAAYGAVEAGRDYNTVDMSRLRLLQDYADPYKAAVEAGCEMIMTSFNTIEGVPSTANKWLLTDLLRETWGFEGVVITDFATIRELITHGVAEDQREAAEKSIINGVDIDMMTSAYANNLEPLQKDGKISMECIDAAVWRVLTLKNKLGLFENPYRGADTEKEKERCGKQEYLDDAKAMSDETIVLLQNKNKVLPVSKAAKIALIGPYSDSKNIFGMWAMCADRDKAVTLKEAFENRISGKQQGGEVRQTTGCDLLDDYTVASDLGMPVQYAKVFTGDPVKEIEKAKEMAKWADLTIFAVGEHALQSGEAASRTDLHIPEPQRSFIKEVAPFAKKSAAAAFNGRALLLDELTDEVDAILECFYPGTMGAYSICDIIYGDVNPSGHLPVTFPRNMGQLPLYYAHMNTGRPYSGQKGRFVSKYIDSPNSPLFPFGYGLTYHESTIDHVLLTAKEDAETAAVLTLDLTNHSDIPGIDVIQLYIHDKAASVVRPVKELKDFRKVTLMPKETKQVQFIITKDMLKFYNQELEYILEPGCFEIMVGKDSENCSEHVCLLKL